MNPDQWKKVDELFHQALDYQPDARAAFVSQVSDVDLRQELEEMLTHYDQAHSFIESPAYVVAAETILEEVSPEQLVGKTLGPYRVLGILGKGGMGVVYRALDQELQRKVALKFLHPELTSDKSRVLRFKQEARAASALNHPNILTVFAIGEIEGRHFISTELVEGETLRELMKSRRMNLSQIVNIASQISSAVAAAHDAGIMHRDIKPENIMLRPDGYLKVLDFGLAKLIEPSADSGLSTLVNTEQGMIIGTIHYMSPEQIRGLQVDERTDIWSLGVVLFEMLTSHTPFEGQTKSDVMAAILEREPASLARLTAGITDGIQDIVTKALKKDLHERYQTAQELLADLSNINQSRANADFEKPLLPTVNRHLVAETAMQRAKSTDDPAAIRTPSSAEYIVSEIKQHKTSVVIVLTLLAFAVTGISFWGYKFIGSKSSTDRFETMSLSRLTSGRAKAAAISPDGKYVAFIKDDGAQRSLWLRQVGTTSDIQISSQTDAGWLVFSPDGDYLYYRNFFGDIARMRVLGGTSSLVIKRVGSSITFSPNGKRFAFLRGDYPNEGESSLLIANADGTGEETLASRRQPDSFERAVAWSPDGNKIACALTHTDAQATYTSVVQVDVESRREEPITTHRWWEINDLAWLSDGRSLLLIATDEGSLFLQKIWQLNYANGQARRITNDFNIYEGLSLTADSSTIVTTQVSQSAHIWLTSAVGVIPAKQITTRGSNYLGLSWSPAGELLYASDRSGSWDIWSRSPDAGNEKQLTVNKNGNLLPSVSPDGRYVFFTSIRSESVNIWRMDIDGGNPKQITHGNLDHSASCSPDGKWLVYVHDTFGKSTLWKVSTDGGTPVKLTDSEAANPVLSPDGKLIACSYGNGKVAIIPFEGGPPLNVFEIPTPFVVEPGFQWTSDGRALTFVDTRGGVSNIWSQPIAGGPRKQITNFQSEDIFSFAWTRDGKQLALARGVETGDVVLITDFRQDR
jgi:eukaryotic-like serine/threonine-protein kinase